MPRETIFSGVTLMTSQETKAPPWLREFEELLPLLLRQARRLVGQEAEDIVQNAFLRACTKSPRDPSAFRRWMTQIVVRTALNRKRQKMPVVLSSLNANGSNSEGEFQVKAPTETSLWKRLDQKEVLKAVQEAMRSVLNCREREALALKMNGYTHREIAMSLGVSLATVESMLHRSLYILRRLMKKPDQPTRGPTHERESPSAVAGS
jgi:RNA polymerase sigma factor (sigma-70 family)